MIFYLYTIKFLFLRKILPRCKITHPPQNISKAFMYCTRYQIHSGMISATLFSFCEELCKIFVLYQCSRKWTGQIREVFHENELKVSETLSNVNGLKKRINIRVYGVHDSSPSPLSSIQRSLQINRKYWFCHECKFTAFVAIMRLPPFFALFSTWGNREQKCNFGLWNAVVSRR